MEKNEQNNVEVQPVEQVQQPVQQPTVNANTLVNNAKDGVNNFVGKLKSGDKQSLIIAIAAGVVALLFLIIVAFLAINLLDPAKGVVNKYMTGMKKLDAEKIARLYPEELIEKRYDDLDELVDSLEETFEEFEDDDYSVTSYKIREYEKLSEDELEELAETLESSYDIDEDDLKEARKYFVFVKTDEDGEKNLSYRTVTVIKVKNKWYLYY